MHPTVRHVLRDFVRPRHTWKHQGPLDENNQPTNEPKAPIWFYRFRWDGIRELRWTDFFPWFGGDEWCRWTIVIPIWFVGQVVIPLWECRNPDCEACAYDCEPAVHELLTRAAESPTIRKRRSRAIE